MPGGTWWQRGGPGTRCPHARWPRGSQAAPLRGQVTSFGSLALGAEFAPAHPKPGVQERGNYQGKLLGFPARGAQEMSILGAQSCPHTGVTSPPPEAGK